VRDTERMVTHKEEGRAFHKEDSMVARDVIWAMGVLNAWSYHDT